MKTEIITITPEMASWLLANTNDSNPRGINKKVVSQYASDMRSGLWQTTHQGIAFSKDKLSDPGKLIDGQHRLSAIVSVGFPVSIVVTFNAPVVNKIDFGLKRQLNVVTGLPKDDLAVASIIISSITGTNPTPTQKQLLCEAFSGLGDMDKLTHHISFITRAPVHAAFMVAMHSGINESPIWYKQLVQNSIDMPPAIRSLRGKLEKDFKSLYSTMLRRSPAYAVALRSIHAAAEGKTIEKLYADSVLDNIHKYDGPIGEYVRRNLL